MHDSGFFLLPNAWDAGSAVRLTRAGFRAIASTSAGAAWAAGKEDGRQGRQEDGTGVPPAHARCGALPGPHHSY
ncbi:isocitrate lyase/phosphoenolpyruvate mutase family protein [Paracoccus angustae]|uniref:Isocitrate lyase/phosphoenolpyruvate mutase family protein n=1 Tax=Paracoccus angustae TaxID=1671480 RepID=A0ABV7UB63_9RHOB